MKKVVKKAQAGAKTSKLPAAKKKGAMDAIKDLGKYVSTGGLATEKYNPAPKRKMGGPVKKAKSGGSFPDLNKDGKVTKADVLVGRGVIKAKKGSSVKKAQLGGLFGKLAGGKGLLSKGLKAGRMGGLMGGLMGMMGRRKKEASAAPAPEAQPAMKKGGKLKKQAAVAIAMKKAGKTPKTMKSGGKMKKCAYGCK
jgi:hypothetical protein